MKAPDTAPDQFLRPSRITPFPGRRVVDIHVSFKDLEFGDRKTAEKILQEPDPKRQKALGRQVANYDDARWKAISRNIVYAACQAKFTQNPHLLHALMQTSGTTLVEASPYDRLWGVGLAANDPRIEDPRKWRGENWLGEVLNRLREDFAAKPEVSAPRKPGPSP